MYLEVKKTYPLVLWTVNQGLKVDRVRQISGFKDMLCSLYSLFPYHFPPPPMDVASIGSMQTYSGMVRAWIPQLISDYLPGVCSNWPFWKVLINVFSSLQLGKGETGWNFRNLWNFTLWELALIWIQFLLKWHAEILNLLSREQAGKTFSDAIGYGIGEM